MRNVKNILYRLSGSLILVSVLLYLFVPAIAPWIMAGSVILFSALTVAMPYPGKSIRGKRLFNFQLLACLLMIVSAYLMFRDRNEWVLFMIVGALFLLYSAVMMPKVLEDENRDAE